MWLMCMRQCMAYTLSRGVLGCPGVAIKRILYTSIQTIHIPKSCIYCIMSLCYMDTFITIVLWEPWVVA